MKWFVDYWDNVVSQWLKGNIEASQECFLMEQKLKLNRSHMPEPYWGNPEDCSIVIANYNPGGGLDRNRHTHLGCRCCPNSFIHEVMKTSYSNVVKPFPIIDGPERLEDMQIDDMLPWYNEYGGSRWWKNKINWLKEIGFDSNKKPFALEYCAWHSVNWPAHACYEIYKKQKIANSIDKYFTKALVDSVQRSDAKLGICIGKQFYDLFVSNEYKTNTNIKLINNRIYPNCQLWLFDIKGSRILVLWGIGRNRYPKIQANDLKQFLS